MDCSGTEQVITGQRPVFFPTVKSFPNLTPLAFVIIHQRVNRDDLLSQMNRK